MNEHTMTLNIIGQLRSNPHLSRAFREALADEGIAPASRLRDASRVAEDVRDFYSVHGFSSDGGPIINAHVSATLDAFVEWSERTKYATCREALAALKKENNLP